MQNNIVNKIKVLLGIVKEQFKSFVLKDGSSVNADAIEINREVYDNEGNTLSVGEYELEDGTKFTVDENGVIKEIVMPDGSTTKEEVVDTPASVEAEDEGSKDNIEPINTAEPEAAPAEVEKTTDEKVIDLETKVSELETTLSELYDLVLAISDKIKGTEDNINSVSEEFKAYKAQPSAKPLQFNEATGQDSVLHNKLNKLKKFNK